ncbi:MAG: extracellular solute-binding protein [Candidatus Levybacteria bacterium]|nr:extracellular solute-binding protein [Candidatus Levybacteria bacterium]
MNENVIFSKLSPGEKPLQAIAPQPEVPVSSPPPKSSLPPASPQPPPPAQVAAPSLPKPQPSSPIKKIAKIIAMLAILLIAIFLIIKFVFPLFSQKDKDKKVTLVYWGLFENQQVMNSLINDFHRENPNITITYVQKDIKQYRQSLMTQIQNGSGPDVFRFHNSWVGMMKSSLSPLTSEVITPEDFKNNYFNVIQQDLTRNGALYGIPLGLDILSLYVNTDLLEAGGDNVPQTWDEFIRVAKDRLVKDSEGKIRTAGAAMGTFDNVSHAPDIIALLMAQNGTNFSNFSSTIENASQALEFYTAFAKDEGSVWDDTLDSSTVAFAKGNLAMYFGYSWDIFIIKNLNPDLKFSVNPVPNLPGRKLAMASYWVEGVSAKSKNQQAAMKFMNYLTKKETLQKFYAEASKTRLFGEAYPRKDLAQSLLSQQYLASIVEQADYATSSYFMSDTYDDGINSQMNIYLGDAVRSIHNTTSPQTAVEALAQGVNQVLSKYGR